MFEILNFVPVIFVVIVSVMFIASAVRILPEYERGVLFRLGRLVGVRGPGLFFIIPGVDRMVRVSLRTVVFDVPPQDVITRDNVTVKVSAVVYFRVMIADKAIVEVENYMYATSQLSQTTLRSVLGQVELDELLSQREKINKELQEILDRHTGPWGVKVSAVVYFRVMIADKAIVEVENYMYATSQLSQTTLRSVLGQVELDELLSQREKINKELQEILDRHTGPWGVKVSNVEVKNIDLPQEMQRAIARQAEAERERRAKVIHAEGELQASEKLAQAAKVLAAEPTSIQLRFLQTLTEISAEKNSTTIFPVPIDLISMFMEKKEKG